MKYVYHASIFFGIVQNIQKKTTKNVLKIVLYKCFEHLPATQDFVFFFVVPD